MDNAILSFIEPVGFWFSSFIKSRHWPLSNRVHSTRGVLPISERMAGFFNEATWRVPELIPLVSGGDTSCVKQDQRALKSESPESERERPFIYRLLLRSFSLVDPFWLYYT